MSPNTFQESVGTWLACQVLAVGSRVSPLLSLSSDVTLEDVNAETVSPVDDLKCRLSHGSSLFFQSKTGISVSEKKGSRFQAVWSQFTRQFLVGIDDGDRLVLAVDSASSGTIREDLRELLNRLRGLKGNARDEAIAAMPDPRATQDACCPLSLQSLFSLLQILERRPLKSLFFSS